MITAKHIHIKGLVQGVGFRPHVYAAAQQLQLRGYVNNSSNGVHIIAEGEAAAIEQLYNQLLQHPPAHAIITHHHMEEVPVQGFNDFRITDSDQQAAPDLMLTPDLALCDQCRAELHAPHNRRYHYPFITCIHCGPRYSIATALPYDRCHTTMHAFTQCPACEQEYQDPNNRRYYSQTNSCGDCGVQLALYDTEQQNTLTAQQDILISVRRQLEAGKIIAVKGIGGFLLMCDARNRHAISTLRERKQRPAKPLALLYPDLATLEQHLQVSEAERSMLQSPQAPIVLCRMQPAAAEALPVQVIAPGLQRLGAMLPYAPLLELIVQPLGFPLIATSANISGSPIIYRNEEAVEALADIADFILLHNRDITAPQDDSVVQFSPRHQQFIMLRRSRGWAPGYYPLQLPAASEILLAAGGELKASFAIQQQDRCYVSQFLGDMSYYESQQSYRHTLAYLCRLLQCKPEQVLVDKHPQYESSAQGKELARIHGATLRRVQHHEAHVAAVLGEHGLLHGHRRILGLAWDGTGYGHDGSIWGSECFLYHEGQFERISHLDYFPILMSDKMSREPRLSALSLLHDHDDAGLLLEHKFSSAAWRLYQNALRQLNMPQTSSMGRLLDGIASLLDLIDISQYEGHAAMLLQALAETYDGDTAPYPLPVEGSTVQWKPMLQQIVADLDKGVSKAQIARAVHLTLARLPIELARQHQADAIAVSGGVWQNSLLTDMLIDAAGQEVELFFHRQLPPNDECISFGQLAWFSAQQMKTANTMTANLSETH